MSTDPLDLPMFTDSGTPQEGRVRSTFRYPKPASPEVIPPRAPVVPLHRPKPINAPVTGPVVVPDADWALVARMRTEVARRLAEQIGETRPDREAEEAEGAAIIRQLLEEDTAEEIVRVGQARSVAEQEVLAKAVFDAMFGLGRIQPLVDDDRVENIMIAGFDRVLVELADGTLWEMLPVAESDAELAALLERLASRSENPRSFTPASPSLHLVLPGGERLAGARDTARVSVVIRRHRVRRVTLADLVEWGTLTPTMANLLAAAVKARLCIVVSGEQGDGKTTLVRALCAEIDPWEAIGTFETEHELFLHDLPEQHRIVHAWEERPGSGERTADGRSSGERRAPEQVIDSFRFTLSRQILGEIRGPEVWSMIKLMESGAGSLSTTHSADAYATMRKLITCAMEAGPHVTIDLAAAKLADTIDFVVHLRCLILRPTTPDGLARKVRQVAEILAVEPGEDNRRYSLTSVFRDAPGACGVADTPPPGRLLDRLVDHGFDYASFLAEAEANPRLRP